LPAGFGRGPSSTALYRNKPERPNPSAVFKQRANSFQTKPNKTKQNGLDFLGFIRPKRDFPMGYGRKNKKNRLASQVVCETSQRTPLPLQPNAFSKGPGLIRRLGKGIARIFDFRNKMHVLAASAVGGGSRRCGMASSGARPLQRHRAAPARRAGANRCSPTGAKTPVTKRDRLTPCPNHMEASVI
jgi:hypothetical protein